MSQVTPAEREFMFYKQGTAGGFRTSLYDTFFKADSQNQAKLMSAFPDLEVLHRYCQESGYWDDLKKRWENLSS